MLAMVLRQMELPIEGIGLILAVDRILDMTRTAVNITGRRGGLQYRRAQRGQAGFGRLSGALSPRVGLC